LFGEEDGDGEGRRRKRDDGADGDLDEMVYEEDFADDDEKIEDDGDDEEAKELEVRLPVLLSKLSLTFYIGTAQEGV
jgi:transcription initiation factor TFIIF subunit alpha